MDRNWLKFCAFAMIVGWSGTASHRAAQAQGNVFVPESSIEAPGDAGVRSHTNHLILIGPAGGLGPGGGMTPAQLRQFYGLPIQTSNPATGGHGIIVLIDAYDYPTSLSDFNFFSAQFHLPKETSTNSTASTNSVFQVVYQGGKKPKSNSSWALEAALDIEWAHAMAPSAKIVLMEAQSNSNANLYAAVDQAANISGVTQISMSWGGSETSGETVSDSHFNVSGNVSGPVFFASSGDTGGAVIYPAASPYVVAVGGTSVATDGFGAFTGETGWSDGGGGNSAYELKPSWQDKVAILGSSRGVPDIASDADPNSGAAVYDTTRYEGHSGWWVVGGTSLASPCMAGMVNLSGDTFTSTTELLMAIYSNLGTSDFRDITSGNNGYPCRVGWDFVTGVGTPQGTGGFLPPP